MQAGDFVICRSGGVWRVESVEDGVCAMSCHDTGETKTVQTDDGEIIRKVASRETLLEAVGRVGFIRTLQAPNDRLRRELYEDAMSRYDEIEWIRVVKTVYLRRLEKPLAPEETAYGEKARRFLHGEISVVLGLPMEQVEGYIASAVAADTW